jgi:aspartate aminotransferase
MKISYIAKNANPSTTLSISAMAKDRIARGTDIVNFSAGEPDFDTPQDIKNAAIRAIEENFTHYTAYEGIIGLRKAVCNVLKEECGLSYDPSQIVISNGSKHALKNVFSAILDPGDEVIVPAPYWNSYIEIIKMVGGVPVVVKTSRPKCFKVTVDQLEKAYTDKTVALIINSPNNPTGMVYSKEELEAIAKFAVEKDIYVISDEIYRKLVYSRALRHVSIASLGKEIYERTIVIDGLSKSFAMTGWRVGYSASNKEIAKAISCLQSNSTSNVNSIAQLAALEALSPNDEQVRLSIDSDVRKMNREFERRRDYIAQRISDTPLLGSLIPKGAFYLFVDVSKLLGHTVCGVELKTSEDVAKVLLEKYLVAVVPSNAFGYENYIRISFATSMRDVVEGSNRIEKFVKENF